MKLVERIAASRDSLTPAEERVADCMAANPHSVGHLSALRLAEAAGVSDATVVRTIRKLGFDGLDDLRESLAAELSRAGRMESSLRDGEVSRHVAEGVAYISSLTERVSEEDLVRALDVLADAARVVVVGFGPARHIADYAAHRFFRAGTSAASLGVTGRDFADELVSVRRGDVVVLLAYDSVAAEVNVLYERAGQLDVPVVQLSEGVLTADPRAGVALPVGRGNPEFTPSHAATVAVLESLVVTLAARDPGRSGEAGALVDRLRGRLSG
ncbi:MAG: MurR/RpiR family transcriptional regulator [Mycobacteriaceae bacterium]|uniref:MurR/RpiR family transcriptional regulator n=1 Tax=Corynebacterium sp. TaxID=1720 RepID=UPI003F95BE52